MQGNFFKSDLFYCQARLLMVSLHHLWDIILTEPNQDLVKEKFGNISFLINSRYIGGFLMVIPCFILIFQDCLICKTGGPEYVKIIYYCFFPSVFNIGWAFMQVSHMSMVCNLTNCQIRKLIFNLGTD